MLPFGLHDVLTPRFQPLIEMDNAFVLDFLRRLAANNNTAWMQAHRADYLRARDGFADLVAEVVRRAGPDIPEIADLTPAQAMFRLHKQY